MYYVYFFRKNKLLITPTYVNSASLFGLQNNNYVFN